jgi:hypothetical protein
MDVRSVLLTATLVIIASGAYAEGNNLADVEVPASTGIYQTTTILAPAAKGYVTSAGGPSQHQYYSAVLGGQSEAAVTAWGGPAFGQPNGR